jgi:hypothetical protein
LLQTIVANAATEIENAICMYLVKNPTRAANALAAIENSLDQSNATKNTFVNTLNYINSPTNQAELISSISTCLTFLNGLQNAIQTDLNNKKSSVSTTAQNMWTTILNDLTALAD